MLIQHAFNHRRGDRSCRGSSKIPCVVRQKSSQHHEREAVRNCWGEVAATLGFESGDIAKRYFDNIRKRLNKARNKIKTAKRSGASTQETNEAIGDASGYGYLSWLVPFINLRKTKSNVDGNMVDFEFDETQALMSQDMDGDIYKSDELNLPTPVVMPSEPNNATAPKFIHPRAAARGKERPKKTN